MTADAWREYLTQYSRATRGEDWSGNAPADPAAIAAAERRLGMALPPSLRAFYAVSNGWAHEIGSYGGLVILPVEQIGWFPDLLPESYLLPEVAGWAVSETGRVEQEAEAIVLRRSLVVSTEGEEAACWLLDPATVSPAGEWAAACPEVVMDADWLPEGFAALFVDQAKLLLEE